VDYKNYIRVPSIRNLFISSNLNDSSTKLMRVMLKDFLDGEVVNYFLTSRKIKKGSVRINLNSARHLMKDILA